MRILITGGTGSLGKALTNHLVNLGNQVIIYSRDEAKQALSFSGMKNVECIIGDVRDFDRLNVVVKRSMPDAIIHAAALKRIDDMELQPEECIKTNISGSENVAKAALLNDIKKCILVSTDKACQPVNVYGSSKFMAERIFTNYDYHSQTTVFSSVRYGNVIASRGSFIPLWLSLLREGKKINVTSLDMTRFLFTLNDAVQTVVNSLSASQGGEVFIPKLQSYNMNTILRAVAKIHGSDLKFNVIGLRPGEKLHEDMLAKTELPHTYITDSNLLCVRPQYSRKNYINMEKYEGKEFNSSLHISDDLQSLVNLIKRGTLESN